MSREDSSIGHRVLLVTENYRLQSIVSYNAVPILTGKKPASNPGLGATVAEWLHSCLPPLRPGFDPRQGPMRESW